MAGCANKRKQGLSVINFNINERLTFTATSVISDEGIRLINETLTNCVNEEWMNGRKYLPPLPPDFAYVWVTNRGKFTKRVGRYYYENYGITLPDALISTVGNLARDHHIDEHTYHFMIKDQIDWHDGDFGDHGSCYWGSRRGAKLMITDNGGYAIVFFNDADEGIARAWLYNTGDFWVVWNGYGLEGNATLIISRMFAQWQGLNYTRIYLYNNHDSIGTLWINGGAGYAIGQDVLDVTMYDFGWPERVSCETCYALIEAEAGYYVYDEWMCESCYNKYFIQCSNCGRTIHRDDERAQLNKGKAIRCHHCLHD